MAMVPLGKEFGLKNVCLHDFFRRIAHINTDSIDRIREILVISVIFTLFATVG